MSRPKLVFSRRTGGLGRIGNNERNWSALCMSGVSAGDVELNTVYELKSLNDAVNLGIDAAYDTDNLVLCYYHIKEFYRMCPGGRLFIMIVSQTVTLTVMNDKATTYGLAKLLRDPKCKGKVRWATTARNPAADYTPTVANGIDTDSIAVAGSVYSGAVVKAQALAEEEESLKRPVHIFVEARSITGNITDLIDATQARCPKVCLVGLQDTVVGAAQDIYEGHASVGTVLGHSAYIGISKSLANPGEGNPGPGDITGTENSEFAFPGISSNAVISDYTDTENGDQDTLYDKGFIVPCAHQGYAGVYLNGDITCDLETSDYKRRANNAVVNEWERVAYLTMVPKIEGDFLVDPVTGFLDPITIQGWKADLDLATGLALIGEKRTAASDVSGLENYINPEQNFLSSDTIEVEADIIPKGYAKTIHVTVGLKNPFKATT